MKLVHALLVAMVGSPNASLTYRELSRRFGDEFEDALRDRLIEELPGPVEYVADDEGRRRRVVVEDGGAVLIDEEDPEEEPEWWPLEDVRRWRVAAPQVIDVLRSRHGLSGEFGVVDPGCWLLGDAGSRRVVLTLASGLEIEAAAEHAQETLASDQALVVVSPTVVVPLARTLDFRARGITFAILNDGLDVVPWSRESGDGGDGHKVAFTHSENYESVTIAGHSFVLSPLQAALISVLHAAERAHTPDLSWSQIRDRLNARNFYPGRARDIRKKMDGWNELVRSVRRGRYRLNV